MAKHGSYSRSRNPRKLYRSGIKYLIQGLRYYAGRYKRRYGRKSFLQLGSSTTPIGKKRKYSGTPGRMSSVKKALFGKSSKIYEQTNTRSWRLPSIGKFKVKKPTVKFAHAVAESLLPNSISIFRNTYNPITSMSVPTAANGGYWFFLPIFTTEYIWRTLSDAAGRNVLNTSPAVATIPPLPITADNLYDKQSFHLQGGRCRIETNCRNNYGFHVDLFELTPRSSIPSAIFYSQSTLQNYLLTGWRDNYSLIDTQATNLAPADISASLFQNALIPPWFSIKKVKSYDVAPGEDDVFTVTHGHKAMNIVRDVNSNTWIDGKISRVFAFHFRPKLLSRGAGLVGMAQIDMGVFVQETGYCSPMIENKAKTTVHGGTATTGSVMEFENAETDEKTTLVQT